MPLTDLTFLKSFSKEDPIRMSKYIQMFLDMAPNQVSKIQQSAASENWQELRATAHSFKAQINYMGISSLKEVILNLQNFAGEETNLEQIPSLVEHLEKDISVSCSELEDHLKALNNS